MLLAFPLSFAHARAAFYLTGKTVRVDSLERSDLPQTSQTLAFLEPAKNVDPKKAMGGGDITIIDDSALLPDTGPMGTIADVASVGNRQGKASLYVVRSGDTFSQIAKMYDVSVNTILWANDLSKGASLRVGQSLIILPINGVQHTAKKGETLQGLARKYKGSVEEIMEFNGFEKGHILSVGETIIIPDGVDSSDAPIAPQSPRARMIANYPSYGGYYTHPVPAGHKTQGLHGYNGVDYGASVGTPVYAAAEGTVIISRFVRNLNFRTMFGGYGNYIIIEHSNGTQTLYGHLSAVYVSEGTRVNKGQPVGEVGNTGRSTGPHLHFEVRGAKNPF